MEIHNSIDSKIIEHVRSLENLMYPENMQMLQDIATVEDLQDYLEGQEVVVVTGDRWYCIIAVHPGHLEVADLAGSLNIAELKQLFQLIKGIANGRQIEADLRKSTSWRLIQFAVKKNRVQIVSEESWWWDSEEMVCTRFLCN